MNTSIITIIESELKLKVNKIQSIGGGCINEARLLQTTKGKLFLKYNTSSFAADLLKAEVIGLHALRATETVNVPTVLWQQEVDNTAILVLEFIEEGRRTDNFWRQFGRALAALHQQKGKCFGFSEPNFIGASPQINDQYEDWVEFYIHARLSPQIEIAKSQNRLTSKDIQQFDRLFQKLHQYFPEEQPVLTHGDLWSGNFLCNTQEQVVLIDPAVSYAHREMDIALTQLFGGFSTTFYESYYNIYPLAPNFPERCQLYQLYYLMVHVTLFGGHYIQSVRQILKRYVG